MSLIRLIIHPEADSQHALGFPSLHGQESMSWHPRNFLTAVKVVLKLTAFFGLALLDD